MHQSASTRFHKMRVSPSGPAIALMELRMTGPEYDSSNGDESRPTSLDEPMQGEDEQAVEPESEDDDWEDWLFL